mmetsp:Transcript_39943/g.64101  ORF Transcript_39943/g.64101 Transcript_39943/m.64101 type:complete len:242 (+) Transcript_39943:207-932(+)
MAEATPHANIATQPLRRANQPAKSRSVGAPSRRSTSRPTDHPSSRLQARACGRCATHHTVGQCRVTNPHIPIHTPTTRPPKVHCCQKLSFRVLPTADDEAEVLAPAFTSSADVDGSAVFCPWPRVGSLEGTGGPSSFILRRNGTPPGLLPTSSQNVSENFCFAAANVMVGSASSAIFASAPSSARPVCDAEELGTPSVSSTPPPRSPPPLAATPTACLGPRNAHTWRWREASGRRAFWFCP